MCCELITLSTSQHLRTRHMLTTLFSIYSLYWTGCYTGFFCIGVYFMYLTLFARWDSIIYINNQNMFLCLWTELYAILFLIYNTIFNKLFHKYYEKIEKTLITTFIKFSPLYKYVLCTKLYFSYVSSKIVCYTILYFKNNSAKNHILAPTWQL